ncbi:HipA domain-containing protein [uncultured Variovorax sp.]|uniref:type II toxin-antitoxin system HipA family toxin n=1 Tax=uncultured Variovorax sp. TaxID=114708 RepID=UPI0026074A06|nr:HipA domain-containing protein [uncultured Variovorax sp.]
MLDVFIFTIMMGNMAKSSVLAQSTQAPTTIVEIHTGGVWRPAATLQALGADRCRFEYLTEYVFDEAPLPIALGLPIGFEPDRFIEGPTGPEADRRPPAFLYDLVPQGKGRKFLLERLELADSDTLIMPLVMAGAFNPIGCLRFTSALEFFRNEAKRHPDPETAEGFDFAEVLHRSQEFTDHLSLHAMLASGTTGVQGVAPKFLLTSDRDGRWFADMALPDERAHEHWLLKLPRGKSDADRTVLRNEAGFLRLAEKCGIRTFAPPQLHNEILFVRRFDRQVIDGKLHRLHQESLASICGLRGFGVPKSQQLLLEGLRDAVSDPLAETIEFMKRDALNMAMRNTDNHARNTAVQRLVDGTIQLTPVFDFAPMYLDAEVIVRGCHWRDASGTIQRTWAEVVETLAVPDSERKSIAGALASFADVVAALPDIAKDCDIEPSVIEACRATIAAQAEQLQALAPLGLGDRHG